jgi:formylglycine-generating enzyme
MKDAACGVRWSLVFGCVRLLPWLVSVTLVSGCSHDSQLDELEALRKPKPAADSPVLPELPRPCVTLLGATEGARVGKLGDVVRDTPAVDYPITLRVAEHCAAGTLQVGLCQRDPSGLPIAPETWQTSLSVEPGREYSPAVTLPDQAGPYLPCVYLDQVYSVWAERVCDGDELLCPADQTCRSDTQTNPQRCGKDCRSCPDGDHGKGACSAGECALRCDDGFHFEAGECHSRPGCKGLETACNGDDCCAIDAIPTDASERLTVIRGYDKSESTTGLPEFQPSTSAPVAIDRFYLDRYEVTVGRFRRFADAYDTWLRATNPKPANGRHPAVPTSGYPEPWVLSPVIKGYAVPIYIIPPSRAELIKTVTNPACGAYTTWTDAPADNESLPINCVNFYVAYLYCIWDGDSTFSRLPSEGEWNAAAAGGAEQRAYPWSVPPNNLEISGRAAYGAGDRLPYAVGSFPTGVGRWGTHDLAGNVFEWVRDTALADQLGVNYVDDADNPIQLTNDADGQQAHALRGGSFKDFSCVGCTPEARVRTSAREVLRPYQVFSDLGIRCARSY